MSPFYALRKLRAETLDELSKATSPVIRSALEFQLHTITKHENAWRVKISISRSRLSHTPAPTHCALALSCLPTLASTQHWSFDEIEAKRQKAINTTHTRLESLFGPTPRALALTIHSLGGIKKCLTDLSLDVFLTLPPDIRRAKGSIILSTIHQRIIK